MTYGIGVDLGSTWATVAVRHGRSVRTVHLAAGAAGLPSVVGADGDGTLVTGAAAAGRATVRDVKRRLGDPTPVVLGGRPYGPPELLAAQLRDVLRAAVRQEGGRAGALPTDVVLTCPTVWGPYRREHFAEAARLAGLPDARVVTEARAAVAHAVATGTVAPGALVLVHDLGGATLDVAVVVAGIGGGTLRGEPGGLERLGGADLDAAVLRYAEDRLGGTVAREDCTAAKERLSTADRAVVAAGRRELRLTRSRYEELIRPLLAGMLPPVRAALDSAGLLPTELDAVLLVGGSAREPLVGRLLAAELGRPVLVAEPPGAAVALGAAALTDPAPVPVPRPRRAAAITSAAAALLRPAPLHHAAAR